MVVHILLCISKVACFAGSATTRFGLVWNPEDPEAASSGDQVVRG
jgi:hypothetical protein